MDPDAIDDMMTQVEGETPKRDKAIAIERYTQVDMRVRPVRVICEKVWKIKGGKGLTDFGTRVGNTEVRLRKKYWWIL